MPALLSNAFFIILSRFFSNWGLTDLVDSNFISYFIIFSATFLLSLEIRFIPIETPKVNVVIEKKEDELENQRLERIEIERKV